MYGFSKDYNDHRIFSYLMYGIVITIIAVVVATAIAVLVVLFNFVTLFPNLGSASSSAQISSSFSKTFGVITPIFGLIGIIWIAFVVRAFNLLSDKSQIPLFRVGAKVLLAGALVNIVIAIIFSVVDIYISIPLNTLLAILTIGGVVQDIAWIFLAMSFFRIQAPALQTVYTQKPSQVPSIYTQVLSGKVKYCPNCGASNQLDASYCTRCGQKL